MPVTEELARLIEEAPDDAEAYRVYADWLEEHHDPRATLIRLQMTRARITDRSKLEHLETRLVEHFAKHREPFFGPLAKVMQAREAPQLEWRNGFVYKAELARIKRMPMHQFLEHLLTHPSGRFLVDLRRTGRKSRRPWSACSRRTHHARCGGSRSAAPTERG